MKVIVTLEETQTITNYATIEIPDGIAWETIDDQTWAEILSDQGYGLVGLDRYGDEERVDFDSVKTFRPAAVAGCQTDKPDFVLTDEILDKAVAEVASYEEEDDND